MEIKDRVANGRGGAAMVAKTRRPMKQLPSDEQLRRESPAYRPDDDWDVLEPDSMQVVVSVRFDARTARRVARIARESGRTASRLLRDWTMERLDMHEPGLASEPASVRETTAPYAATDADYETLRERYRPPGKLAILMVGESRPAGGTFFYLANSNLYYATRQAFAEALGPMPPGEDFLRYLADRGVWLYDLAAGPVDRLAGRPRKAAVSERIGHFVELLRDTEPKAIVAVKRDLSAVVRRAMADAGAPVDRLRVVPFPLYQWRREFVRGLAEVAQRVLGKGKRAAPHKRSLAGALKDKVRRQPADESWPALRRGAWETPDPDRSE